MSATSKTTRSPSSKKISTKKKATPISKKAEDNISEIEHEDTNSVVLIHILGESNYEIELNVSSPKDDVLAPLKSVGIETASIYPLDIKGLTIYMDDEAISKNLPFNSAAIDILCNTFEPESQKNDSLCKQLCRMNFLSPLMGGIAFSFANTLTGKEVRKRLKNYMSNMDSPYIKVRN